MADVEDKKINKELLDIVLDLMKKAKAPSSLGLCKVSVYKWHNT